MISLSYSINFDEFEKIVISTQAGIQAIRNQLNPLDSPPRLGHSGTSFHGNDGKRRLRTFYGPIILSAALFFMLAMFSVAWSEETPLENLLPSPGFSKEWRMDGQVKTYSQEDL